MHPRHSYDLQHLPDSESTVAIVLLTKPVPLGQRGSHASRLPEQLESLPRTTDVHYVDIATISSMLPRPVEVTDDSTSLGTSTPFYVVFSHKQSSTTR